MKQNIKFGQSCDVLVVGGGGAALMAALEAKKQGMDVLMVSKGRIGRSGNTIIAGSGFSAYVPFLGTTDSEKLFFKDTMSGGKGINEEKLVEVLVRNSGLAIKELETYGVEFLKIDQDYVRRTPPGHSQARSLPTVYGIHQYYTRGLSITLPLRNTAARSKVRFMENSHVIKLLKSQDQICGAVAINLDSQEIMVIKAKTVALATGGGGRIYAQTNNTRDVTGDGYALALEAGATLVDMEFVQYYPSMMIKPVRFPVSTPLFGDGAVFRNSNGERFLRNYDPAGDMATRDSMARASFFEILAGRGVDGGVYVDCSGIPTEVMGTKYRVFRDFLINHGLNPQKDWLIVSPTVHFFMGGIKIDQDCMSEVPGLFAAGEVCGGIHGANRLSGNALTETIVFGKIAGQKAAEFAHNTHQFNNCSWELQAMEGTGHEKVTNIRRVLREAMWKDVSIVRSQESLQRASEQLRTCRWALSNLAINNLQDLANYAETKNMITVAQAVALAAMNRCESRGSHFRTDYPRQDDSRWMGNIQIVLKKEELAVEFCKV